MIEIRNTENQGVKLMDKMMTETQCMDTLEHATGLNLKQLRYYTAFIAEMDVSKYNTKWCWSVLMNYLQWARA